MNSRNSIADVKNMTLANRLGAATLRKVTIGLMAMGLALSASTQFTTMAAHASTASSFGTVTAAGRCNITNHTMTMSGTIDLNLNRFPNGADVWTEYAYARATLAPNGTLQATGPGYYTGWNLSHAEGWYTYYDIYGPQQAHSSSPLAPVTVPVWGEYLVWARVALFNGSSWEYSNWDRPTVYGLDGTLTNQTTPTCRASFT
jgi:hypothetical protein